jgi:hypothetical protein
MTPIRPDIGMLHGRLPPRDRKAASMTSLDRLRARFARNDGLPFADVLTEARIHDALDEHGVRYRDRVFSPVTTIWGFLSSCIGILFMLALIRLRCNYVHYARR